MIYRVLDIPWFFRQGVAKSRMHLKVKINLKELNSLLISLKRIRLCLVSKHGYFLQITAAF